ncbi:hypothetical protein [Nocardioides sp. SR21]|uniref:hypothetical protein n=1 Tax=Nocardioides sp. SR21 TaxID=2919501 RepID=UPI001FA9AEA1|nr:hypothetical protein [Nocardioides sp. SR21]
MLTDGCGASDDDEHLRLGDRPIGSFSPDSSRYVGALGRVLLIWERAHGVVLTPAALKSFRDRPEVSVLKGVPVVPLEGAAYSAVALSRTKTLRLREWVSLIPVELHSVAPVPPLPIVQKPVARRSPLTPGPGNVSRAEFERWRKDR